MRQKTQVLQYAVDGTTINVLPKNNCDIYVMVDRMKKKNYTDQTGKFPVTSGRGTKYLMIMCEVDSNAILAEPMKTKT